MATNFTPAVNRLFLVLLIIAFLYLAKPVLVPLAFAALLAMVFHPVAKKLESYGIHKAISSLLCVLGFLAAIGVVLFLLGWQVSDLASDVTKLKSELKNTVQQARDFITEKTGLSEQKQEKLAEQQNSGGKGMASTVLSGIAGALLDFILVVVYMFLLLFFRKHLVESALKMAPINEKENTRKIIYESGKVGQKYLSGMGIMILTLWVLYSIGFSISGLKNPILFAVLCGTLEIVPFIGNLTGTAIAVIMALMQGGDTSVVIGVIATYAIVQFVQTYVLETLIIGERVNINPLFTIICLVAGELIWGIPGMVLAIPITGIFKIVCDRLPVLNDIGFLIGPEAKNAGKRQTSALRKKK